LVEDCEDLIRQTWAEEVNGSNRVDTLRKKLMNCQRALVGWSSNRPGPEHLQLKLLYKRLGQLQKSENLAILEQISQLQGEINKLLEIEDFKWKQQVKRNWYKLGDRNTQFFHAWANQRRRQNHIGSIADLEARIWTQQQDIGRAFTHFYQNLFTFVGDASIEDCISSVQVRVPPCMNEMLTEVFTPEEVNQALAQMHPLKSSGPDGFGGCFFQKHWLVVGDEVRQSVLDILNHESFDPGINSTFITLVPKKASASTVNDFCPISLSNVNYKLIAKVLANRFKKVLPVLISPAQSAFVPGRLITDNVLVAYEALHSMTFQMRGRQGYMAIKLDMSKAYDRVE
jgi:hypothetical protein